MIMLMEDFLLNMLQVQIDFMLEEEEFQIQNIVYGMLVQHRT